MQEIARRARRYLGTARPILAAFLAALLLSAGASRSAAMEPEEFPLDLEAPAEAASNATGPLRVLERVDCLHSIAEDYDGLALSYPTRLYADAQRREIYVTDTGNSRILVYTYDFFPLLVIGRSDGLESPAGMAVDREGNLYVAQGPGKRHRQGRISVYNPALIWKRDIVFSGFEGAETFNPRGLAVGPDRSLYVAGKDYPGVVVLDPEGLFSRVISPRDSLTKKAEKRAAVCDVEVDGQGNVYLLSEEMSRIYVYDSQDRLLFKFGIKGGGTGKLSRPRGLAVDEARGRIYVADYMRHAAQAYSLSGDILFEFGGRGWRDGWFQFPSDIVVDAAGKVLVADTFNNRVQVLDLP
ncbi:MAG: NHL repeat-containing protein [Thermodesulfobacteriota bacterium]